MLELLDVDRLIARVRSLSDIKASGFNTDAEIRELLKESLDELVCSLVERNEGYFLKRTEDLTPTNKNQIMYPADLYKVRLLEQSFGGDHYEPVPLKTLAELSGISSYTLFYGYYGPRVYGYSNFEDHVKVWPEDGVSGLKFRLNYTRSPLALTTEKLQSSWQNYLSYQVAYLITTIEHDPNMGLKDMADKWRNMIQNWASQRDSSPKVIAEISGDYEVY